MKKAFIGVDPGKAGFITIFVNGEYIFYAMPEHKIETGELLKSGKPQMKTVFHEEGIRDLIFKMRADLSGCDVYGCIEEVSGRQGWSAQNNFNFGRVAGLQKMILIMLGVNIEMVRPQKWQSVMYHGHAKVMKKSSTGKTMVHDTKATSAIVAQAIAPEIDFRKTVRSKKMDDNKTDSFLMCRYITEKIENKEK